MPLQQPEIDARETGETVVDAASAAKSFGRSSARSDEQSDGRSAQRNTGRGAATALEELLKGYEELWRAPDAAKLRAAEEHVLQELTALSPTELVALLRQGLSTRRLNLVLIALENAMRGPDRSDYEDALVAGMEDVFERPDRLETLAEVTLRFQPSPENAEAAARLLMKHGPAGPLAEHLGGFASRLEGESRREVERFAVERALVETLGRLVDDAADVARLEAYLGDPATSDRARQALERVEESTTSAELRRQVRRALLQRPR
jgi:hypothetical protein